MIKDIKLESSIKREQRIEKIVNNYEALMSDDVLKKEFLEIGKKPISTDSFLDMCDLLNDPDKIDRDELKKPKYDLAGYKYESVYFYLNKEINNLKNYMEVLEKKNYDKEFQKTFLDSFESLFKDFTTNVSSIMIEENQYDISCAMPITYLNSILSNYGFSFDEKYFETSFSEIDESFNTGGYKESGRSKLNSIYGNGLVFKIKENDKDFGFDPSQKSKDLKDFYDSNNVNNTGSLECDDFRTYMLNVINSDDVKGKSLPLNYNKYFLKGCQIDDENKKGFVILSEAEEVNNRIKGLVEFVYNDKGKTKSEFYYTEDFEYSLKYNNSNDYSSSFSTKDRSGNKLKTYSSYSEYYFDKNNTFANDKLKKGNEIKLPKGILENNKDLTKFTYEITQLDNNKENIVIKELFDNELQLIENPKYYLVKNVNNPRNIEFYQKDKNYKLTSNEKNIDDDKDKER